MKRIAAVTLIVAASFITAGSVLAQTHKEVAADIPFNFTLNGRSLPAGHYTIETDSSSPDVFRIEDRKDSVQQS